MQGAETGTSDLIQSARRLTRHLQTPKPSRYWLDFLAAYVFGCTAFYFTATSLASPAWRSAAFVCCVLSWYRSIAFIHELAHVHYKRMPAFHTGWNLIAGIPFLCPSFLYASHWQHHSKQYYGTHEDGEYLPWGLVHPRHLLGFTITSLAAPLLAALRFGIVAPAGWLMPSLQPWIQQRASALVVHSSHRRTIDSTESLRNWRVQEIGTFLWLNVVLLCCISGRLEWRWPLALTACLSTISFLNAVRTVTAHRFRNAGRTISPVEQVEDSVNHPGGGLVTELLCPVGLRYHSLHHMLPSLPYHSLPEAHRILMRDLPAGSAYREVNSPNLLTTLTQLLHDARIASASQRRRF
jgi:fatty acid desaturase